MGSTEIRVPKLNSNDTSYTVVEWLVAPGGHVDEGDVLVTVETAKASEDLPSTGTGVLHPLRPAGAECAVGELIGLIFADEPERRRFLAAAESSAADSEIGSGGKGPEQVISKPARRRMAELGVDPAAVRALDRTVIRAADIEALAGAGANGGESGGGAVAADRGSAGTVTLPPVQRAVSAAVVESHRTVPAAFVAVKVRVDAALAYGRELTRRHRCLIGLPELVVKAVAAQLPDFPLCFATPVDADRVRLADRVDVGVTIDVGTGLYVPVVRDAAARPLPEVAKTLMGFRTTAMRGGFRPGELAGATVLLALHTEDDVSLAVPVLLPGTVCAVSLAGRQRELDLDDSGGRDSGGVVRRTVVQLGLAYDHRVVNGREAVALLVAVRELLEDPQRLPD